MKLAYKIITQYLAAILLNLTKFSLENNMTQFLSDLQKFFWHPICLIAIALIGGYMTVYLRGIQFTQLVRSIKLSFGKIPQKSNKKFRGDITQKQALMTSLAAAIGTGNIAGVATAIASGGLGAIFWMWVIAILGMALKYSEAFLGSKYRITNADGEVSGGPMFYLSKGLGLRKLAVAYAVIAIIGTLSIGNATQINSVADALFESAGLAKVWSGILVSCLTGLIILGGIKSVGRVAEVLVPFMAVLYILGCLTILFQNAGQIPAAFKAILDHAFYGQAAAGGFAGATVQQAIQYGFARGIFSSEAGMGTASIALASAKSDHPARPGLVSMSGVFISTVIICSMTGLVIAVTGVLGKVGVEGKTLSGTPLVIEAFRTIWGGSWIVTVGLVLFSFTTILAWSVYGEKSFEYIAGIKGKIIYRVIFVLLLIPSALLDLELVWKISDICVFLMILPNAVAFILSAKNIRNETNLFLGRFNNKKNHVNDKLDHT